MTNEIDVDVMTDEELSQMIHEIDPDYEYERYRDDWGDRLYDALKVLYKDFVECKKHGYYKDMPEKFLEHAIGDLKEIAQCDITAFEHNIHACKREAVKTQVEFVKQDEEPIVHKEV